MSARTLPDKKSVEHVPSKKNVGVDEVESTELNVIEKPSTKAHMKRDIDLGPGSEISHIGPDLTGGTNSASENEEMDDFEHYKNTYIEKRSPGTPKLAKILINILSTHPNDSVTFRTILMKSHLIKKSLKKIASRT